MNEILINGISFFVEKKNGGGVRCRVGHPECPQAIYIPLVYFNDDLSLKNGVDLTWMLRKRDTQVKFNYYKTWSEGFELRNRLRCLEFPASWYREHNSPAITTLVDADLKAKGLWKYRDNLVAIPHVLNTLNNVVNPLEEPVSDTTERAVELICKILKSRGVQYQANEDELNAVITPLKELDKQIGAYNERFLYEHEVVCRTINFINKQCYVVKD